jgi:hypothetical protein
MGIGGIDSCLLNLTLVGGEWSASCPCHFNPGKEPLLPVELKVGWAPDVLWMVRFGELYNVLSLPGMER